MCHHGAVAAAPRGAIQDFTTVWNAPAGVPVCRRCRSIVQQRIEHIQAVAADLDDIHDAVVAS